MGNKQRIIDAFGKALRDFGYSLTDEEVEAAIKQALAEEEPSSDVIAMFIHGWLNGEFSALKPECERLFGKEGGQR